MKSLIIDSHKSVGRTFSSNLHLQNAKIISDRIGAKLIWSYKGVNEEIEDDFDAIIFNHSSFYSFIDFEWIERSPNAKLFYIVNEYNCGEPHALWNAVKRLGRKYTVITNVGAEPSKIVKKYTEDWIQVNLNSLIFDPKNVALHDKEGCVYYGSYRKGREKYFKKYFDGLLVSTHSKNQEKFNALGVHPTYTKRINWSKEGLTDFSTSLYIEDEVTHVHYNYLANRFYEALNYNVVSLFDVSCRGTVEKSGYDIPEEFFVDGMAELQQKTKSLPVCYVDKLNEWKDQAQEEREQVLETLEKVLTNL